MEALARSEGASGAVALRGTRVVGFLLGVRKSDERWGATSGSSPPGMRSTRPRTCATCTARRPRAGWRRAATATTPWFRPPAGALVTAWSRVSFGQQHAHGIREVPDVPWPDGVRLAEERDIDALVELSPLIVDHQALSPVFGIGLPRETLEEIRAEILEDLAKRRSSATSSQSATAGSSGRSRSSPRLSSVHAGLARPEARRSSAGPRLRPVVRGSGAGLALTEAGFAWARERGYETMVTDWRVTNLLASRFWPARGFRESFLRLYRRIP